MWIELNREGLKKLIWNILWIPKYSMNQDLCPLSHPLLSPAFPSSILPLYIFYLRFEIINIKWLFIKNPIFNMNIFPETKTGNYSMHL